MKKSIFIITLISLILFSCKKEQEMPEQSTFNVTVKTYENMFGSIPVILSNGLDYFKIDTFNIKQGKIEYSGVSDSVVQLTFRFPKKDINLYVSSGDTLDVSYNDDIIRVSGDSVNTRLYEFYRKNVYYMASLANMKDTLENYLENPNYNRVKNEWRGKISDYISAHQNNLTANILLKENLQYYDEVNSVSNLHKAIEVRYPVVSRYISNYIINNRMPYVKSKINSFTLRNEYKKKEDDSKTKKNFNIFDNNDTYNIITFWSYKDSVSVERVKELKAISKKYKGKKLSFVTVSLDYDMAEWQKKVDQYDIPGRNFIIPKGLGYDVPQRLGIIAVPTNIITNDKLIITGKNMYGKELNDYLKENIKK